MIAGPLDKGLADDIYNEQIDLGKDKKTISEYFQQKYEWVFYLKKGYFSKQVSLGVWARF